MRGSLGSSAGRRYHQIEWGKMHCNISDVKDAFSSSNDIPPPPEPDTSGQTQLHERNWLRSARPRTRFQTSLAITALPLFPTKTPGLIRRYGIRAGHEKNGTSVQHLGCTLPHLVVPDRSILSSLGSVLSMLRRL